MPLEFVAITSVCIVQWTLSYPGSLAHNNNNNNNNNELYSVHIHTYIQVADVGMIESAHVAAH